MYKLYLDDERYPPADDLSWRIARNYDDACWYIRTYGMPSFISFDHDLGAPQNRTGYDFAHWLINYMMDNDLEFTFEYYVHSMNPVGAENIRKLLENYRSTL